jgi:basic amino acid/polyamine antiporter, APA family
VIALILVVGITYFKASNLTPYIPSSEPSAKADGVHQSMFAWLTGSGGTSFGWLGLLSAASLVFFAFVGFDVVATTAEETRNPQRNVPRGIFGSLAIVTVLYVAVSLVLTGMVSYGDLAALRDLDGDRRGALPRLRTFPFAAGVTAATGARGHRRPPC